MNGSRPASGYFAHVDGLRALAVLAVMVYHLYPSWLPGGFIGVDVFFVISGFVVTASLAGHQSETAGDFLARFYARRLARLVPALVVMLVVTTALYVLFVPQAWFNRAAETVGQTAFWGFSNWTLHRQAVNYFEPRAELNPFTHTWSLGVEEQFYLIAPLFLYVALATWSTERARHRATVGIAVLAALSLAACIYFAFAKGPRFVFYLLTFRFWELAAGVLLYLHGSRIAPALRGRKQLYRFSGWVGLSLVALAMLFPKPNAYPWLRSTIAVGGTLLLIGLPSIERRGPLQAVLASGAAIWIGHRSYSLYLWHWPLYVLARWTTGLTNWPFNLLTVAGSFAAAALCYRTLENPIRYSARLKHWRPAVRISIFLLVLCAGWLSGRILLKYQPVLSLGQPARHAADWYPGRGDLLKSALAKSRKCDPTIRRSRFGDEEGGQTEFIPESCENSSARQLFVIGDSHAGAYMPMLEQLSAEQGRRVRVLQVPGCSYLDMNAPMRPGVNGRCFGAAQAAMRAVLEQSRHGDIVFLPSLRLPRFVDMGGPARLERGANGVPSADLYARSGAELAAIREAAADARRWITPFLDAGLNVVFEAPKPILRAHPFRCIDWFNRENPDCAAGLSEDRLDQERFRQPIVDAINQLVASYAGVSIWDPLPTLCNPKTCNAVEHGRPLFFDADHVTPYANLVLLPSFRAALEELERK